MKKVDFNLKTAPPAPEFCQKNSCGNKTTIAFMRVFNKDTGKTETGGVSGNSNEVQHRRGAYAYVSSKQLVMNDKYDYIGWVTRCGFCYQDDLKAQGKRSVDYCRQHKEQMKND